VLGKRHAEEGQRAGNQFLNLINKDDLVRPDQF